MRMRRGGRQGGRVRTAIRRASYVTVSSRFRTPVPRNDCPSHQRAKRVEGEGGPASAGSDGGPRPPRKHNAETWHPTSIAAAPPSATQLRCAAPFPSARSALVGRARLTRVFRGKKLCWWEFTPESGGRRRSSILAPKYSVETLGWLDAHVPGGGLLFVAAAAFCGFVCLAFEMGQCLACRSCIAFPFRIGV